MPLVFGTQRENRFHNKYKTQLSNDSTEVDAYHAFARSLSKSRCRHIECYVIQISSHYLHTAYDRFRTRVSEAIRTIRIPEPKTPVQPVPLHLPPPQMRIVFSNLGFDENKNENENPNARA